VLLDDLELAEKLEKEKMKPREDQGISKANADFEALVESLKSVESLYGKEEDEAEGD